MMVSSDDVSLNSVAPPPELTAPESLETSSGQPNPITTKNAIRTSLKASTLDGVFATVFSNITGGVLLTNFLLQVGASPAEIGLLAAIPMLANLLQPIGAWMGDRTNSRHSFCLWIYGPSRLLWLVLAIGIAFVNWGHFNPHLLVFWTLAIAMLSYGIGALGSAAWFSWMAMLVPRRLRGRYFGIRNSAANLTNLISVPLGGWLISKVLGGSVQAYGVMLVLAVMAGIISLMFQNYIVDVDPQVQHTMYEPDETQNANASVTAAIWQDKNFVMFLLYFALWMFSVNLSGPFFNLYLLDNLKLDISTVTIYNSLTPAANLLMLMFWGRLADRIGNRPLLLFVGILVAITPPLWLITGSNSLSIWLWLPLLHILTGGTWAAIDLCTNNIQIGIAPVRHQSTYFGIAAAIAGISSGLGTVAGGLLAQYWQEGGLFGLFLLSGVLRMGALLPLVFVHEHRSLSLRQWMQVWWSARSPEVPS